MIDLKLYGITVCIVGAVSALMLVQLLIADVVGIRRGHVPGHPVDANHDNFLFRANRAFANSNESVAIFILAVLFALSTLAGPTLTNLGAIIYLVGRLGHMTFYYLNQSLLRSVSFGLSLLGIVLILIAGFRSLLAFE